MNNRATSKGHCVIFGALEEETAVLSGYILEQRSFDNLIVVIPYPPLLGMPLHWPVLQNLDTSTPFFLFFFI